MHWCIVVCLCVSKAPFAPIKMMVSTPLKSRSRRKQGHARHKRPPPAADPQSRWAMRGGCRVGVDKEERKHGLIRYICKVEGLNRLERRTIAPSRRSGPEVAQPLPPPPKCGEQLTLLGVAKLLFLVPEKGGREKGDLLNTCANTRDDPRSTIVLLNSYNLISPLYQYRL